SAGPRGAAGPRRGRARRAPLQRPRAARSGPPPPAWRRLRRRRPPSRRRAPRRAGWSAPPSPGARPRRSRPPRATARDAPGSQRAAAALRARRTPSGDRRRAVDPSPRRRGPPRSSDRGCRGLRLRLRRALARRPRDHLVEPLGRLLLGHVLRVHQLRGEDLLGLDEHLLLAGREALVVVAQGEVAHHLGELEDVAGLHLVAVVLEAAV